MGKLDQFSPQILAEGGEKGGISPAERRFEHDKGVGLNLTILGTDSSRVGKRVTKEEGAVAVLGVHPPLKRRWERKRCLFPFPHEGRQDYVLEHQTKGRQKLAILKGDKPSEPPERVV